MKKQIMRALLGFAMSAVLVSSAVTAGAQSGRRLVAHVPFDFVVGQRQLPAGDYSVRRLTKDSDSALLIQGADGRGAAAVMTNSSGREPARAELVFRRNGDGYFLSAVSIPGTASVREVPPAKERRTREMIEQAKAGAGETVTVRATLQ